MSKYDVEQEQIKPLLAKNLSIRLINYVKSTVNTREEKMIESEKDNKIINNQDK